VVKIKRKLLIDLLVYVVSPILFFSSVSINKFTSNLFYLFIISTIYTSYTKYKQNRINISGIAITVLSTIFIYFLKICESEFDKYIYITYLMGIMIASIIGLNLIGKNICNRIYIDILNIKGVNTLSLNNFIRKRKLDSEFNFLTDIILLHLIFSASIRFYSITHYGVNRYEELLFIEVINLFTFISIELYNIYVIVVKTVTDKHFYIKGNIIDFNMARIINLNQYKRMNK